MQLAATKPARTMLSRAPLTKTNMGLGILRKSPWPIVTATACCSQPVYRVQSKKCKLSRDRWTSMDLLVSRFGLIIRSGFEFYSIDLPHMPLHPRSCWRVVVNQVHYGTFSDQPVSRFIAFNISMARDPFNCYP